MQGRQPRPATPVVPVATVCLASYGLLSPVLVAGFGHVACIVVPNLKQPSSCAFANLWKTRQETTFAQQHTRSTMPTQWSTFDT